MSVQYYMVCYVLFCYVQAQRIESAAYVWDLIQNCLEILGISGREAMGLWSLLAAIFHLGYAGVKKSELHVHVHSHTLTLTHPLTHIHTHTHSHSHTHTLHQAP